jgi:hypothetical protein
MKIDFINVLPLLEYSALTDSVLLTGSLIEGYGNEKSDCDFYILQDQISNGNSIFFSTGINRVIDVSYFSRESLQNLLMRVLKDHDSCTFLWDQPVVFTLKEANVAHRLFIGKKLTKTEDGLLLAFNKQNKIIFNKQLAKLFLMFFRNSWIDFLGEVKQQDKLSSYHMLMLCLGMVADAYCALKGITYIGEKWRIKRLSSLKEDPLALKFRYPRYINLNRRVINHQLVELAEFVGFLSFHVMSEILKKDHFRKLPVLKEFERLEYFKGSLVKVNCDGHSILIHE